MWQIEKVGYDVPNRWQSRSWIVMRMTVYLTPPFNFSSNNEGKSKFIIVQFKNEKGGWSIKNWMPGILRIPA
jgi:hypothetical protein